MGRTPNRPKWNQAPSRQAGGDYKDRYTKRGKRTKIFPGSNPISIIVHRNIITTNKHPQEIVLKKQNEWKWTQEHMEAFNNLKKLITQLPCLARFNADNENIITTDASTKGLGATLWQKQNDGNLKPIRIASRFLSDTEKKYAINELELQAVVWELEQFRLNIYGKPIE